MPFPEAIETDRPRLRRFRPETAEHADHHRYTVT
jgi:hypothetical protein